VAIGDRIGQGIRKPEYLITARHRGAWSGT